MKPICLFLTVILCAACLSKSKDTSLGMNQENNDKEISEIKLHGELLHCDSIIWGVKLVAKVGKNMIVQAKSGNPVFWVYTLNKDTLIEQGGFLKNGEGPYEMMYPDAVYDEKMNKLFVYDFAGGLRSLYGIDLHDISNLYDTSTWQRFRVPEIKSCCLGPSLFMMNKERLLVLGSRFHSKNLCSYINFSRNQFCEVNYPYPAEDGTFNMEPVVKQSVYIDGMIVKHPSLDKFVYACGTGMYADIISYTDTALTKEASLFNIYPRYTTKDGVNRSYHGDCLRGMQVRATEKAIYVQPFPLTKEDVRKQVSYKGYPNYYNDELFVFDWEGHLMKKYVLDTPVYSYIIDEANRKLYGMTVNLEDDEPCIVSYTLL